MYVVTLGRRVVACRLGLPLDAFGHPARAVIEQVLSSPPKHMIYAHSMRL